MIFFALPFREVSEWLKEHAWKACVRVTVPRVRISSSLHTGFEKSEPFVFYSRLTLTLHTVLKFQVRVKSLE